MEPSVDTRTWSDAELMALPDAGVKYELVQGEIVAGPAGFRHEMIGARLIQILGLFVQKAHMGVVCGSSLGCRMDNGNLRSPDVSFVSQTRIEAMGGDVEGFLKGAPDLAVEILSPSDSIGRLNEKAVEYFENGSRLVWIINPEDRTVTVQSPDGPEKIVGPEGVITGEDPVPGFSMPVMDLFP